MAEFTVNNPTPASHPEGSETEHPSLEFSAIKKFAQAVIPHPDDALNGHARPLIIEAIFDKIHPDENNPESYVEITNLQGIISFFERLHYYHEALPRPGQDRIVALVTDLNILRDVDQYAGEYAGNLYVAAGMEAQLRAIYELCDNPLIRLFDLPHGIPLHISGDEFLNLLINPHEDRLQLIEQTYQKHMRAILETREFIEIKKKLTENSKNPLLADQLGLKVVARDASEIPPLPDDRTRVEELLQHLMDTTEHPDKYPSSPSENYKFLETLIPNCKKQLKTPPELYEFMTINNMTRIDNIALDYVFPPELAEKIAELRNTGTKYRRDDWIEGGYDSEVIDWGLHLISERVYPIKPRPNSNKHEFRMVFNAEFAPEIIEHWAKRHGISEIAIAFLGPPQLKPTNKDHGHLAGDKLLASTLDFTYQVSDEILAKKNDTKNDILIFKSRGSAFAVSTPDHITELQNRLYELQINEGITAKKPGGISEENQPLVVFTGSEARDNGYKVMERIDLSQRDHDAFKDDLFKAVDRLRNNHYGNEKLWLLLFRPEVFWRTVPARIRDSQDYGAIYAWLYNEIPKLPFAPTLPLSKSEIIRRMKIAPKH